jgi:hypothetical protein
MEWYTKLKTKKQMNLVSEISDNNLKEVFIILSYSCYQEV